MSSFAALDRASQRHHSAWKYVARPELARFHDDVAADDVWHEAAHLLVITNVVARQLRVGSLQFGRTKIAVAIEDLLGREKLTLGRGRQLEAARRIDLVQFLQIR